MCKGLQRTLTTRRQAVAAEHCQPQRCYPGEVDAYARTVTERADAMRTVADAVAPDFKAAGFRKRRYTFNRAARSGVVQVVNFQMERYVVPPGWPPPPGLQDGSFTVNLGVYVHAQADLPARRWPWVNEAECEPRARLGELLAPDDDAWALD